jgi:hypothetical protein
MLKRKSKRQDEFFSELHRNIRQLELNQRPSGFTQMLYEVSHLYDIFLYVFNERAISDKCFSVSSKQAGFEPA